MADPKKTKSDETEAGFDVIRFIRRLVFKKIKKVYYTARESIGGGHKRAMVVQQVEQACSALQETRDVFEDALQRFKTLVHVADSPLEQRYQMLHRQYQFCSSKSDSVSMRIRAIEEISEALFAEWENELSEYTNRTLRNHSKQQLKAAKQNYSRLIKSLRAAEAKIQPVLAAFKDQVLYLKHNLNAHAIAALQHEFIEISIDIAQLIQAMEHTIAEASRYVNVLTDQKALPSR